MNLIDSHIRATMGSRARTAMALLAALPAALPLHAAEQATGSETTGLEEIIVTAQFRSENLQDTPLAITAASGSRNRV